MVNLIFFLRFIGLHTIGELDYVPLPSNYGRL
jgi:hypothetical protein